MTTTYATMSEQERRQVRMYGCTEAQMRDAVEESLTFRFSGPAMYAMSIMSDVQEVLAHMDAGDLMALEDVRQMLNRAKWILSSHCMKKEAV